MTTHETLYRKVQKGKRHVYEVAYSAQSWDMPDLMKPGTFRLVHAYKDGGRRYEYEVQPDTAAFVAAASIARIAMEEAIAKAPQMKPMGAMHYTRKQQAVLADCRAQMAACGAFLPTHWHANSAKEISQAAIDAVRNYKP